MPDKRPHTVAVRLTHYEYLGLIHEMKDAGHSSLTECIRDMLGVHVLEAWGKKVEAGDVNV